MPGHTGCCPPSQAPPARLPPSPGPTWVRCRPPAGSKVTSTISGGATTTSCGPRGRARMREARKGRGPGNTGPVPCSHVTPLPRSRGRRGAVPLQRDTWRHASQDGPALASLPWQHDRKQRVSAWTLEGAPPLVPVLRQFNPRLQAPTRTRGGGRANQGDAVLSTPPPATHLQAPRPSRHPARRGGLQLHAGPGSQGRALPGEAQCHGAFLLSQLPTASDPTATQVSEPTPVLHMRSRGRCRSEPPFCPHQSHTGYRKATPACPSCR